MLNKLTKLLAIAALCSGAYSCRHSLIRIESSDNAKVDIVEWDNLNGIGIAKGNVPVEFPREEVESKVLRVSGKGKLPLHVYMFEPKGEIIVTKIQLDDVPTKSSSDDEENLIFRLLIRSYQELTKKNWNESIALAEQMSKLRPKLAAPHILIGMALLKNGRADEARNSLVKARALDPSDPIINEMIESSNQ